jgi:hypothetical protein
MLTINYNFMRIGFAASINSAFGLTRRASFASGLTIFAIDASLASVRFIYIRPETPFLPAS